MNVSLFVHYALFKDFKGNEHFSMIHIFNCLVVFDKFYQLYHV